MPYGSTGGNTEHDYLTINAGTAGSPIELFVGSYGIFEFTNITGDFTINLNLEGRLPSVIFLKLNGGLAGHTLTYGSNTSGGTQSIAMLPTTTIIQMVNVNGTFYPMPAQTI